MNGDWSTNCRYLWKRHKGTWPKKHVLTWSLIELHRCLPLWLCQHLQPPLRFNIYTATYFQHIFKYQVPHLFSNSYLFNVSSVHRAQPCDRDGLLRQATKPHCCRLQFRAGDIVFTWQWSGSRQIGQLRPNYPQPNLHGTNKAPAQGSSHTIMTQSQVCWWDDREPSSSPAAVTEFLSSHRDAVPSIALIIFHHVSLFPIGNTNISSILP